MEGALSRDPSTWQRAAWALVAELSHEEKGLGAGVGARGKVAPGRPARDNGVRARHLLSCEYIHRLGITQGGSCRDAVGVQKESPPEVALWHTDSFELKAT